MEQTTFLSLMYAEVRSVAALRPVALAVVVIVERVITFALVSGKRAVLDRTRRNACSPFLTSSP
jgi:hypothetical protein